MTRVHIDTLLRQHWCVRSLYMVLQTVSMCANVTLLTQPQYHIRQLSDNVAPEIQRFNIFVHFQNDLVFSLMVNGVVLFAH